MEIIIGVFWLITAFVLLFLLIQYLINKTEEKWYSFLLFFISCMLFIFYLTEGISQIFESPEKIINTYEYQEGYKAGINTKFEQHIDTVYIKKN